MQTINQPQPLAADFFDQRSTFAITKDLLGKLLIYNSPQGQVGGYIVEAEAYLGRRDPGAHAFAGRRVPSNEPLYGAPGTIYIYAIRGFYAFDVVTQPREEPEGILIRGLEPVIGIAQMKQNRPGQPAFNLTSGPGKLMQALNIHETSLNSQDFQMSPLKIIADQARRPKKILTSERIGVRTADSWADHYRAFVSGNPYVSRMRKRDYDLTTHGWQI